MAREATKKTDDGREHFLKRFMAEEQELRAIAWEMLHKPHSREGVFQDIAVVLWTKFERFDQTRPFLPWARGSPFARFGAIGATTPVTTWFSRPTPSMPLQPPVKTRKHLRLSAIQSCLRKLPEN